jgi:hypothetical protein
MDSVADSQRMGKMVVNTVDQVEISEKQVNFIAERGGIMTIYRAASMVG